MEKSLKELNKIPYLNEGGCGIAALAIKRKYKRCKLVKLVFGFFPPVAHIAVKMDKQILDSTGIKKKSSLAGVDIQNLSEPELVELIKDKKKWFGRFDRKHIAIIEKKLNVNLSDIK